MKNIKKSLKHFSENLQYIMHMHQVCTQYNVMKIHPKTVKPHKLVNMSAAIIRCIRISFDKPYVPLLGTKRINNILARAMLAALESLRIKKVVGCSAMSTNTFNKIPVHNDTSSKLM